MPKQQTKGKTMFNPHGNKTANGKVITEGMAVRDYDYQIGIVVADRYGTMHEYNSCRDDHWFEVKRGDGTTKDFNGERLIAL
jgi:hypothetical protein